jgi:hypothetical protein
VADTPPVPRPRTARARGGDNTDATDTTGSRGNGGNGGADAGSTPRPPRGAAPPPRARAGSLESKLGELFGSFSLVFAATGDQYCAEIVAQRSPALAAAWADLAKQNASVKRVLEGLVEGSAWGAVIFSTLGITIPIAKHHGLYNGPDPFALILPGPTPPEGGHTKGGDNGGTGVNRGGMRWSKGKDGEPPAPRKPNNNGNDTNNGAGDSADEIPTYLEGAPPGVVTVAASGAQHNGAR